MMGDVVSAQREHVLVVRPFACYEFGFESFLLEESFLDRAEDRRLAGQPDIADPDLVRGAARHRVLPATGQGQRSPCEKNYRSRKTHAAIEVNEKPEYSSANSPLFCSRFAVRSARAALLQDEPLLMMLNPP